MKKINRNLFSADVSLEPDTCLVFSAKLSDFLDKIKILTSYLDKLELKRSSSMILPVQQRYIIARGLLRLVSSVLLKFPPEKFVFKTGKYGKPYFVNQEFQDVFFNYSHSGDFVLYAFSCSSQVGIDIEQIKARLNFLEIAERFFCPEEVNIIKVAIDPRICFYRFWSAKESFIKAVGTGLSFGLKNIAIALTTINRTLIQKIKVTDSQISNSYLSELSVASNYTAHLTQLNMKKNIITYDLLPSCFNYPDLKK